MLLLKDILSMSTHLRLATIAALTILFSAQSSLAQTSTKCNPTQGQCPPDPALGGAIAVDFSSGADTSQFNAQGNPTYGSDGVSFTVAAAGEAPQLNSNWYIMFGKYEVTMKAATGAGIVSSLVLQSDDLDEIDWEFLGAEANQVQSNYFGKGQTTSWDRGATHDVDDTQNTFHTYGIEWTDSQIVWQIDGTTVRVLSSDDADGQFPQTPCRLKMGAWSAGDGTNAPGTIAWAQGPTNYADGPFTMVVQKLSVTDYSTGTQYTYGDESGSWTSIESTGGKVNGNTGGSLTDTPAPAITTTSSGGIQPFDSSGSASATSATNYPGLPSGWSVNPTTGKVVPPSSAATPSPKARLSQSSAPSPLASCSGLGYEVVTSYNEMGFPTTATVVKGATTTYNNQGAPVTVFPSGCNAANYAVKLAEIKKGGSGVSSSGGGSSSDSSKVSARWSAGIGTLFGAVVMAALLC